MIFDKVETLSYHQHTDKIKFADVFCHTLNICAIILLFVEISWLWVSDRCTHPSRIVFFSYDFAVCRCYAITNNNIALLQWYLTLCMIYTLQPQRCWSREWNCVRNSDKNKWEERQREGERKKNGTLYRRWQATQFKVHVKELAGNTNGSSPGPIYVLSSCMRRKIIRLHGNNTPWKFERRHKKKEKEVLWKETPFLPYSNRIVCLCETRSLCATKRRIWFSTQSMLVNNRQIQA